MADPLGEKAFAFALRIVKLSEFLHTERKEFVLSKKILDSGVNISLFIEEARQGENRADFLQKYSVANKEAFKSNLLLRILAGSNYISDIQARSLLDECEEIQKMLISAIKTTRKE
jgi:four helix bundle protein